VSTNQQQYLQSGYKFFAAYIEKWMAAYCVIVSQQHYGSTDDTQIEILGGLCTGKKYLLANFSSISRNVTCSDCSLCNVKPTVRWFAPINVIGDT